MNQIQQLKEDYERRAKTAKDMSDNHRRASDQDVLAIERIDTKASLYREFAYELGKLAHLGEGQTEDLTEDGLPFVAVEFTEEEAKAIDAAPF